MQPPKSSICVICGINPATTVDHVPPKGFFKGISGQFRTVPACNICNNGSSKDDEALRNYISAQIGKQTEGSKKLWEKGAHKSLKRNTQLCSALLSSLNDIEVINKEGKTTSRLAFLVPVSLYQRVFERVTRGLFFFHTGKIFPVNIPVTINLLTNSPDFSAPELQLLEYYSISDKAFEYRFGLDPEDYCNSMWIFSVHNAHWIQASTGELTVGEL